MTPLRVVIASLTCSIACNGGPDPLAVVTPPAGLTYAYAAPSCAPWDGYAVSLVLRVDSLADSVSAIEGGTGAALQLAIYPRAAGGLVPGTYEWPANPDVAGGARCESGSCTALPRGAITIRRIGGDQSLEGSIVIWPASGAPVHGGFRAAWRPRQALCG